MGAKPLLAVDTKALGGMYAGKIRLVATESGVGINLNNVTSTQRDISLTTAGKITLSNVKAQTDLNISANSLTTTAGASVRAERDMTLAATSIDNHSNTTASGDIRVLPIPCVTAMALRCTVVKTCGSKRMLREINPRWWRTVLHVYRLIAAI